MSISTKPWIPKEVISCLKELKRDPDLRDQDFHFLSPLFEDENMKSSFELLKDKDRTFFYDLFYPLLAARKYLLKRRDKHAERDALKLEAQSLQKQIKKMRRTLTLILSAKHYDVYLFRKFPALLDELDIYNKSLNSNLKNAGQKKNALRPVNHKNLRVGDNKKKSDRAMADYCARILVMFFEGQGDIKLKPVQRKKIICDMVNTLVCAELTPKDLDDLKRNG